jgi:hypothetical protein
MSGRELDSSGSAQGTASDSCEYGNEHSDSIIGGECLN